MEPKIRFKGYMFGWVSEAIGLYYNFKNGLNKSKEYFGFGTPIVNFTDVFNNRVLDYASLKGRVFVTKEEIANYSVQKGDLFFTRTSETLEEIGYPSVMLSDSPQTVYSGFVLRGRAINNDPLVDVFKSYVFFTTSFRKEMIRKSSMTTRALTSGNRLKEMIFTYPKAEDEQFKIGNYFLTLDNKIQTTSKKLESLKKLKSASLVAMFPQNGESTPKVRFKGFEGEWSTNNLGSIFAERIESNENGEMLSVTMNNGIIRSSDNGRFDNSNSDKSKYKVVKIGDIAYNSMRMWQGASGVSQYEGIVSPAYTVVTPSVDVDTDFFGYLFKTDDVIRLFKLNSQGLTSDNWNLKYPAFSRICVSYPESKEEQQAIATFFRSLDRKIALETARLEKLKQIKLACLDKMFV